MVKEGQSQTAAVQVALRIRPLTQRDRNQPRFANLANDDILKIRDNTVHVVPHNKLFSFDMVFGPDSQQSDIFSGLVDKLIHKFVDGYNVTILAYGQTSSGKTYTMGTAQHNGRIDPEEEGIVPRSMALLFDILQNSSNEPTQPISPTSSISSSTSLSKNSSRLRPLSRISTPTLRQPQTNNTPKSRYSVKVSFVEIYNEELIDLLNTAPGVERPPVTIREDTRGHIYWTGVKEMNVQNTDDVLFYLEQGTQNRATGATDMNEKSSRSHAIFSVTLRQEKWSPGSLHHPARAESPVPSRKARPSSALANRSSNNDMRSAEDGEWMITTSKFHFVDLAGSERLKRTAAEGDRRKEGININAGLLALGNVISALGDPSKRSTHIPYRDSKLTRLLQDSLGGSATTLMIACASPVENNLAETLNTLQYANRARNIKNKIEKNEVEEWMTTDNIELLRNMIGKLKNELRFLKAGTLPPPPVHRGESPPSPIPGNLDPDQMYQEQRMMIADLQRQVEELDGEASVTRERNRMVEAELKRLRKVETVRKREAELNSSNNEDFQHLVEPVIEEYEKSIAALESQLAMSRAALNHSDIGFEEQQTKIEHYESVIDSQEHAIGELRLRLGKVLEREHSNDIYIEELESKLMRSADDAMRDQELLNELKVRIMKFKETDENTEQYILDLEQRLTASESKRAKLTETVEQLESQIAEKEKANHTLKEKLSKQHHVSTEKLLLQELDDMTAKYQNMEIERNNLQKQVEQLTSGTSTEVAARPGTPGANNESTSAESLEEETSRVSAKKSGDHQRNNYRRSLADEKETAESTAALNAKFAEERAQEEAARAQRLEEALKLLQNQHEDALKELDEVTRKYEDSQEQIKMLEDHGHSHPTESTNDLDKEITRAKEEAYLTERENHIKQIAALEQNVLDLYVQIDQRQSQLHDHHDVSRELQTKLECAVDEKRQVTSHLIEICGLIQHLQLDVDKARNDVPDKQLSEEQQQVEELEKMLEELDSNQSVDPMTLADQSSATMKDQSIQSLHHVQRQFAELQTQYKNSSEALAKAKGYHKEITTALEEMSRLQQAYQNIEAQKRESESVCAQLQEKIETLQMQQRESESVHAQLEEENEAFKNQLEELRQSENTVKNELSSAHSRIQELEVSLQSATRQKTEVLQQVQRQLEKLKANLWITPVQVPALREIIEPMASMVKQGDIDVRDMDTLERSLASVLSVVISGNEAIEKMDAAWQTLEAEKETMSAQFDRQQQELDAALAANVALREFHEKNLGDQDTTIAAWKEEHVKMSNSLEKALSENTGLNHTLQAAEADLKRLQEQLQQKDHEHQASVQHVTSTQATIEHLKSLLEQANTTNTELKEKLIKTEEALALMESHKEQQTKDDLNKAQLEAEELEALLQTTCTHKNELQDKLLQLEREFEEYKQEAKGNQMSERESVQLQQDALKQLNEQLTTQKNDLEKELADVQTALNETEDKMDHSATELEHKNSQIQQLEQQLQDTTSALTSLKEQSEHQNSTGIQTLQQHCSELESQLDGLEKEKRWMIEELTSLRTAKATQELEKMVNSHDYAANDDQGVSENGKNDVSNLSVDGADPLSLIKGLEKDLAKANDLLQSKDLQIHSLQSQVDAHIRSIFKLREELDNAAENKESNALDQSEREDLLERLDRKDSELFEISQGYEKEIDELKDDLNKLLQELDTKRDAVAIHEEKIRSLEATIHHLESTLAEKNKTVPSSTPSSSSRQATRDNEVSKDESSAPAEALRTATALTAEKAEMEASLEALTIELQDWKCKYDDQCTALEQAKEAIRRLETVTADQAQENSELMDCVTELDKQMLESQENHKKEIQEMKEDLDDLITENATLEKELALLKQSHVASMPQTPRASSASMRTNDSDSDQLSILHNGTQTEPNLSEPSAAQTLENDATVAADEDDQETKKLLQDMEQRVKEHQRVIAQLEGNLKSKEMAFREAQRQVDVLTHDKQSSDEELEKAKQDLEQQELKHDQLMQEKQSLEKQLTTAKQAREKAEQAKAILENRLEELLNRKNKFICF